ncbi:unnamed protein product [Phytophthora fragariaefolia]|uniref:Unnamed protein product n=1 Tax=Phytophthora fragariaefolia TaxID=1490495 RepID=A0A9W7CWF1_9STRA|nr:unnamed protein product [Phytophthora fragariaefolia]
MMPAPEAPAHKNPDVRSERKAATGGETQRGAQPDAAKRARPANAKSAERKGRDASSQNNKSKKTPKYRGSSDDSDSDSSSGRNDQDSYRSDSSPFEDVVPNVPTLTGPGGTIFTFRPYVNASALEDFDEKASLAVRTRWLERFQSIAVQGGWKDKRTTFRMVVFSLSVPDEPTSFKMKTVRTKTKTTGKCVFRMWWRKFPMYHRPSAPPRGVPSLEVILKRMEAKHKTSKVPSSGSSRTPDGGLLRMESFDRRPDHPVSKTGIAPSSVDAAMILDILPRAAGPTSSVIAVAARGTLLGCAECDLARSVRSFMKTNVENGKFQAVKTLARQVKLTSLLDGDPERVGLKNTPELCVLVYVGPELRRKSQYNHQCMTVISENEEYLSDLPLPDQLRLEEDCPDNNDRDGPPEFRLGPGQRYGWREEHNSDETKKVAMVHGAVNNCRTDILLDSGASVSMMSLDLVPKIGEGVDVLLGMNFMYSAGVRLCAREGLVKLPDEETVLLAGRTADHMGRGLDLAITSKTCLYLGPGESAVVWIDYGQSNPQREVVWAGRGDRWVTQIIYAAKSWPVAVKVVNTSDKTVWIVFPNGFRKREERLAQLRQESEPPCVRTPEYQWPKKLLVRSPAGSAQVHVVRLQPRPNVRKKKSPAKTDVQLSETEISGTSDSEGTESREAKSVEKTGGEDSDSDDEAFYDAISFGGDDGDEDSQEVVEAEPSTGTCSDRLLLPVRRLEKEYERCMQMSAEELSLEPVVYIHEGSELLAQLRDELAMLPELQELSPECDINKADVGNPDGVLRLRKKNSERA